MSRRRATPGPNIAEGMEEGAPPPTAPPADAPAPAPGGAGLEDPPGDGGPGLAYMPYVVMDDLLDKLKLLAYDQEFLIQHKMKPINR